MTREAKFLDRIQLCRSAIDSILQSTLEGSAAFLRAWVKKHLRSKVSMYPMARAADTGDAWMSDSKPSR
jgi:hypothetical protein